MPRLRRVAKKVSRSTTANHNHKFAPHFHPRTSHTQQARNGPREPCVLTPAEGHCARPVGAFLHQRLVELAARRRVDTRPARLTVILQTGHVGTEERSKLAAAVNAGTFVADLVIENVRLHLNLAAYHMLIVQKIQKMLLLGALSTNVQFHKTTKSMSELH